MTLQVQTYLCYINIINYWYILHWLSMEFKSVHYIRHNISENKILESQQTPIELWRVYCAGLWENFQVTTAPHCIHGCEHKPENTVFRLCVAVPHCYLSQCNLNNRQHLTKQNYLFSYFDINVIQICYLVTNWEYVRIGLGIDLAMKKWQDITLTDDDTLQWRIHYEPALNETSLGIIC